MKATGIIRRIDDLGRVVIPKEIRRSLRIHDGDELEIYVDGDAVIYKKAHPLYNIRASADKFAQTLESLSAHSVLITDRDMVIAVAGVSRVGYAGLSVSDELESVIESRRIYIYQSDNLVHPTFDGDCRPASVVCPIILNGDIYGSVVLLADDRIQIPSDVDVKLAQYTAAMIGCQLEE